MLYCQKSVIRSVVVPNGFRTWSNSNRKLKDSSLRCTTIAARSRPTTLLIDNYDSYTYNLYQLLTKIDHVDPLVILNDEYSVWKVVEMIEYFEIDSIVISPGPGRPDNPIDVGICLKLVQQFPNMPILGVCLGHQILAEVYGAKTKRVEPIHGRLSCIEHNSHPLFDEIPSKAFSVVRYHSLAVEQSTLPDCIEPIAWTHGTTHVVHGLRSNDHDPDSILMGLAHKQYPHFGVQFHPESIASDFGVQLMRNFKQISGRSSNHGSHAPPRSSPLQLVNGLKQTPSFGVIWKEPPIPFHLERHQMDRFFEWFIDSNHEDTFWLDSALEGRGRFSYLGKKGGSLWKRITYELTKDGDIEGILTEVDVNGFGTTQNCSLWNYLDSTLHRYHALTNPELPFDFHGGFVGYLGYELKALCGGSRMHEATTPDATLFFIDQFLAIDHELHKIYCVALTPLDAPQEGQSWIDATIQELTMYLSSPLRTTDKTQVNNLTKNGSITTLEVFRLDHDQVKYEMNVERCKEYLFSGESYEICLTTQFRKRRSDAFDPWAFYRLLRRRNPAPFAAWLNFKQGLIICSSSPERFLKADRNQTLEAKPIKGTVARKQDPIEDAQAALELASSEKDQAENLMIVDLLRNDLGRVCQASSVHVPSLIQIESYQTVHQLVSTIRGILKENHSIIDAIKAAFPGGSMTGAPKVRSMEILDQIESRARGVYSGSLGYISVNQTFDLNIIIRSVVVTEHELMIGAGGAIVIQSEPRMEFEEMQLKARILLDLVTTLSQIENDEIDRITKLPENKIKDSTSL